MGCEASTTAMAPSNEPAKKVDPRLPFSTYRQLFSMKNWWKAVTRSLEDTAKDNLISLLDVHPEYLKHFPDIAHLTKDQMRTSLAFETAASDLFNNLDEVMNQLEPADNAITLLRQIGSVHKAAGFPLTYFQHMEHSFLASVKKVLDDRYTEKCEDSFKNLYAFMLQHISEGYN